MKEKLVQNKQKWPHPNNLQLTTELATYNLQLTTCILQLLKGQYVLHKPTDVVMVIENVVEFGDDGEFFFYVAEFGYLVVEDIDRDLAFEDEVVGDVFGEEAFADEQSEGTVAAQVVQGGEGEVAEAAVHEDGLLFAAELQQNVVHLTEGLGKDHETDVRGVEMGIHDSDHDGINVLQYA